jgi:hypothetical protein
MPLAPDETKIYLPLKSSYTLGGRFIFPTESCVETLFLPSYPKVHAGPRSGWLTKKAFCQNKDYQRTYNFNFNIEQTEKNR